MGCCYDPPVLMRRQSCSIKQNKIFKHISAGLWLYDSHSLWLQVLLPVVFCILPNANSSRAAAIVGTTRLSGLPLMDKFYWFKKHFASEALPSLLSESDLLSRKAFFTVSKSKTKWFLKLWLVTGFTLISTTFSTFCVTSLKCISPLYFKSYWTAAVFQFLRLIFIDTFPFHK